jgi:dTDP-glucose pyrophosphorylase
MIDWHELIVDSSTSLRTAMEIIDKTGLQTALVNSIDGRFLGTLTDGDIRRAILSGATLTEQVESYVNHQPVIVSSLDEQKIAYAAMERLALRCVPVVNEGKVIGLLSQNKSSPINNFHNPVLIMAGGRGERLKPLTNTTPKPLMKVGGKALLEILLDKLASCGFSNIWISVHYLSEQIEELIGSGEQYGLKVNYIKENSPLGTAGAYLNLPKEFRNLDTLIVNADLVTNVDFAELLISHINSKALVTIGVIEHLIEVPFGVIQTQDGQLVSIIEKPTVSQQIYAGVGVYSEKAFEGFQPNTPINATDVFEKLLEEEKEIRVFEISGYWRDIGTGESLQGAHRDLGLGTK